jgi:glycosyltransferase involved in cell wall biosynthesis
LKKQKKAILHIIDSLGIGGAENILVGIINSLTDFNNHLIVLNGPEILLPKLKGDFNFKNLHAGNLFQLYIKQKEIRRYIKENKIDIVHSHLYLSNVAARLATPANIPVYNTIHNVSSLDAYKKNRLTLWIEKLTYKKRHHIIAVSNEVLKDFDTWVGLKGKSAVFYNFIENKFWGNHIREPIALPAFRLIAVGNLRHQKNYRYALEAFKSMPPGVTLDIYGEGDMRNQLQREIDQFKLPIRLCGSSNDIESVLPPYDAFLMTSFNEGQPVSLLEAMACGLPALLSDIPVLKEVAGDNALYFNIDDPQNLVRLIESIQSGKFNLTELSGKSLERVEKIAKKDHYMKKLCQLYLA